MKKIIKYFLLIIIIIGLIVFGINTYIILKTKNSITDNYQDLNNFDCIIVLGAGVWDDSPSFMLQDRLDKAIELYKNKVANKIIMSGDHGKDNYDEVNVMKQYAIDKGIPSEDIFMDHAGFSTYDSMYRAKEIFDAKKVIVVTQKYHLYRALYIANSLDLEAYGVSANPRRYAGAEFREIREVLARNKDFIKCIIKPKPIYLGEIIPVNGNGNITNDKDFEISMLNAYFLLTKNL